MVRTPSRRSPAWLLAVWALRALLAAAGTLLALLGLLAVGSDGALHLLVLLTGCTACLLPPLLVGLHRGRVRVGYVLASGVALFLVVLVTVGWVDLGDARAPATVLLVVVGVASVLRRWSALSAGARHAASPGPAVRTGRHPATAGLAALVELLPTDVLLAEWSESERELAAPPGSSRLAALVGLRVLLLDELEVRDPDGFAAWQRAATTRACSPGEFLGPRGQTR